MGYRAQLVGTKLQLNLGYSHPIEIDPPEGIAFEVENPTRLAVLGIDKELVGQRPRAGPRHAQARALQGQGRALRGRGRPPQGRQGRQDRRRADAPASDDPTPRRTRRRASRARHEDRRPQHRDANGHRAAPAPARSATRGSACAWRGPRASRGWPCSAASTRSTPRSSTTASGPHARQRLLAGGRRCEVRDGTKTERARAGGRRSSPSAPGGRRRARRLRPCRVPVPRADPLARRRRARVRPGLLGGAPWHASIPTS